MGDTRGGHTVPKLHAVDNTTLEVNASGEIQIKDLGVVTAKLDNDVVTDAKADGNFICVINYTYISTAVQSVNLQWLSGNAHLGFFVECKFINDNAGAIAEYGGTINNDGGANYDNLYSYANGANNRASVKTVGDTALKAFSRANIGEDGIGKIDLYSPDGSNRILSLQGGNTDRVYNNIGIWKNTADNLTSMQITGTQVDSIGVGSQFRIWKYRNY